MLVTFSRFSLYTQSPALHSVSCVCPTAVFVPQVSFVLLAKTVLLVGFANAWFSIGLDSLTSRRTTQGHIAARVVAA